MRAGSLDRLIAIEHATVAVNDAGTPKKTWATLRKAWAQVLQLSADDREGGTGSATEQRVSFRIRWFAGLTLDHRIMFDGGAFTIKSIKELGRREGYELACERAGS
jgi:SPP1 family predicted phage head-tail adaptor